MEPAVEKGGLSASALKYWACLFMVIDHIGMFFEPMSAVTSSQSLLFYLLRYLGRPAFPIFAYFAAVGCRRTSNYRSYLIRLGSFGLVTHLIALFATGGQSGSVIATFFLAALGIWLYRILGEKDYPLPLRLLPLGLLALVGELARVDYGWLGVAVVGAVYLCGEDKRRQLLTLGLFMAFLYLVQDPLEALLTHLSGTEPAALLQWYFQFLLPFGVLCTLFSLTALLFLRWYTGARGRSSRWFFYWFYPLHILVLYGLEYFAA